MPLRFRFSNFRSFREEQELSLVTAASISFPAPHLRTHFALNLTCSDYSDPENRNATLRPPPEFLRAFLNNFSQPQLFLTHLQKSPIETLRRRS